MVKSKHILLYLHSRIISRALSRSENHRAINFNLHLNTDSGYVRSQITQEVSWSSILPYLATLFYFKIPPNTPCAYYIIVAMV